jgi:hypothetical protein
MKYYIYISDAKVDMLFPQVPHDIKKKVALEFKMDLKLLSASRRVETEGEDNRIARLEAVVNFIREYGNVGLLDEHDDYLDDSLAVRWVAHSSQSGEIQPTVYFSGQTEKTLFGLGGSSRHLLGNNVIETRPSSSNVLGVMSYFDQTKKDKKGKSVMSAQEDGGLQADVRLAATHLRGPEQTVEFFAKKLIYWPESGSNKKSVLLATPLYVAMVD